MAVVTGASRGIGFEIAKEFALRGASVVICSRSRSNAESSAALIQGKVYAEQLDVTNMQAVTKFTRRVLDKHKHIDVLVNNAGYPFDRSLWYKRFHDITETELDATLDVDLKGSFRLCKEIIPIMLKSNMHGGTIINISSTPAIAGYTEGAPYSIAKAGILALTKHIALEYGKQNIRAYTLALGNITTEAMINSMTEEERKKAAAENAMKRWGSPNEVATVAASIAEDNFSFATGNTIVIDGGTVLL